LVKRDSQRSAVYKWEHNIPKGEERMPLSACANLVKSVWMQQGRFERWCPVVKDGRGARRAWGGPDRIALPRHTRNMRDILHEVAHALLPGDYRRAWHGPEWASLYLLLLVQEGVIDGVEADRLREMGQNQKPRKVRFL